MSLELTPDIKAWLDTPAAQRDILAGAMLLLRINHNMITYNNIVRNPASGAALLEYELQKAYNVRVQEITREEVKKMLVQVDAINQARGLDKEPTATTRSTFQQGRRADHDQLPAYVQAWYVENADLMKRMRDCHTHLRLINADNSSCPDSDRYPYAKEIIALDRQYRDNWNKYDHYVAGSDTTEIAVDRCSDAKKALRMINLNKGRYAATRSESLGAHLVEWYNQIATPSEQLTAELTALGLLS